MSGTAVANAEGVVLVTLLVAYGLWFVIGRLRSSRPALHIGIPIAVGYSVRLAAIAGVGATGLGASLRGVMRPRFWTTPEPWPPSRSGTATSRTATYSCTRCSSRCS